jgi:hypothetical protein
VDALFLIQIYSGQIFPCVVADAGAGQVNLLDDMSSDAEESQTQEKVDFGGVEG